MKKRILFIGDSITDAGRDRAEATDLGKGYPLLIAGKLISQYPTMEFECMNRGIGGDKIADLQVRWQEDCLALQPDYVSILIGINDTWHNTSDQAIFGTEKSAQQFESVYRKLLNELQTAEICNIILMEPFVLPITDDRHGWRKDLDPKIQIVRKLAKEYGALLVPLDGIFNALGIVYGFSKYTREDGVHPTIGGHEIIAQSWIDAIAAVDFFSGDKNERKKSEK
ncbi:TPA: SGNH/GDSL hydrolase family protein [Enterococcus faecium]|uniref:SGNH/GDSL hydrolase family protein n=1 Tax=Enterococcus TaxID=1350 RepID=UPI001B47B9E7|nr:SGNH/GDSL hydrolase family protein [Enterococcus sp.]HAP7344122.1 SGNH/GDSL hydrolase family protein [Enterococcus faecium]MBP8750661.1 SGNH/GDSL hydrolase family protein [Enterococcus sp.]HAP7346908.1 SGNH/GDSL hydrolase family protein [Enterococcus faecium]HAP7459262.1 SGNH/GDSL hydrolase family protein [Enterococcus faecium]HAP7511740.1 SGNH/GDSL hydrolase family protein [Enterococcus faecium]